MPYFIGLDVGTTGAKAVLINEKGTLCGQTTEEYPMSTPKPLWCEQDPEEWWNASVKAFRQILKSKNIQSDQVKGIGLTGQMHGLVLLDENGNVLRPCIMWNDQRTAKQCEEITQRIGNKTLLELIANPVLPGFTLPKLLWVRKQEPGIYEKIKHILLPKDYVRYKLTGVYATDVSDASGMAMLDVANRKWSDRILREFEIPGVWLPRLFESVEITGNITEDAAKQSGLSEGTPVAAGGGDQAAGAVGCGVVSPGIVSITIGTSGVVFAHSDMMAVEPEGKLHSFCHAVPDSWHLMGVTLAAGGSLRWYRDTFGNGEKYDALLDKAQRVNPGADGVFFLPYLAGERTPYPDPNAQGAFFGLTLRHDRNHFIRAVLEGVAYSLRDCLELMKAIDIPIRQIRLSGGGAKSLLWRQIISDVINQEVVTLNSTEGAPYGAALLASVGTGYYSTVEEICEAAIEIGDRNEPDKANIGIYDNAYHLYRQLYPALKEPFVKNTTLLTGGV